MSCSRELVTGSGQLRFAHPSTQQHLLVWRERPRSVMVLKKRGSELAGEFVQVVRYLGETERLRVVVEPAEYDALLLAAQFRFGAAGGMGAGAGAGAGGTGGGGGAAASATTGAHAADGALAASSRYLYTFTPQERERGLADAVDFVVCLGGDGVILHAGGLFGRSIPPVVSFHLGSMGFLTNHDFADFRSHLRDVIHGSERLEACSGEALAAPVQGAAAAAAAAAANDRRGNGALAPQQQQQYEQPHQHEQHPQQHQQQRQRQQLGVMVTLRMRLECSVVRRGCDRPEQVYEVLNEVVVDRGADSFLTNLECRVNGRLITRVQADGVMLATASGSTAYSAAAGGSMVHPNVPSILLTPVCPHSLNFRPVVLPDYVELELRVPDAARAGAWVCFDGKHRQQLGRGDSVHVRMSPNPMPTINKADLTGDWFESLERCFRWSNRAEQKALLEGARAGVAAEADSSNSASRDDRDEGAAASDGERAEQRACRQAEAEAMARAFAYAAAMEPAAAAAPPGGAGAAAGAAGGLRGAGSSASTVASWDGGAPGTPTAGGGGGGGNGSGSVGGGLGSSVPVNAYYAGPALQGQQEQQQQPQQQQPGSPAPPAPRALSPFAWTPLPPMPPPPGDW